MFWWGGGLWSFMRGQLCVERAVLAAGTILTGSTPVYDLVLGKIYQRSGTFVARDFLREQLSCLVARAVENERGRSWGLSLLRSGDS